MKRSPIRCLLALAAIIVVVALLLVYRTYKEDIVRIRKEAVEEISEEIDELKKELGLDDNDVAIRRLQSHRSQLAEKAAQAENNWLGQTDAQRTAPLHAHLESLIALHTHMLESYKRDLHDYRKLGIASSSNLMQFTHAKIDKLKRKIAKLTHNLQVLEKDKDAARVKLGKLRTLCAQTIGQYKQELRSALATSDRTKAPRVAFLKARLGDKIRTRCQIDQLCE